MSLPDFCLAFSAPSAQSRSSSVIPAIGMSRASFDFPARAVAALLFFRCSTGKCRPRALISMVSLLSSSYETRFRPSIQAF